MPTDTPDASLDARQWLPVATVAARMGVSERTVQRRAKRGELDAREVSDEQGKRLLIGLDLPTGADKLPTTAHAQSGVAADKLPTGADTSLTERPAFETRGRRYKRRTPYKRPRPDGTRRDLGEGDPDELGAVFASRADYFKENPQRETLQEIAEDSRDLGLVVQDFPGLHAFVFEIETVRMKAVDRLELLNRTRRELVNVTRELEAVKGVQPQLRARVQELERQIALQNITATGAATVEDLRTLYGFGSKQGVTKHLRRLQENGQIQDSGARQWEGDELRIIQTELSRSERTTRGKVKNKAS